MTVILLEGPDAAGKTTLAREICRLSKGSYLHATYRFPNNMFLYQHALLRRALKLSRAQTEIVVIDRLHLSHDIYGKIYRNEDNAVHYRLFDRVFTQRFNFLTVHCVPNTLREGIINFQNAKKERQEMYDLDEKMEKVIASFSNRAFHLEREYPGNNLIYHRRNFDDNGEHRISHASGILNVAKVNYVSNSFFASRLAWLGGSGNWKPYSILNGKKRTLVIPPYSSCKKSWTGFYPDYNNVELTKHFIRMEIPESDLIFFNLVNTYTYEDKLALAWLTSNVNLLKKVVVFTDHDYEKANEVFKNGIRVVKAISPYEAKQKRIISYDVHLNGVFSND